MIAELCCKSAEADSCCAVVKAAESNKRTRGLRGTILSAGAQAAGGIGDAFLYPLLPVFGSQLGLSVIWVGVLLSVNKYIRIFANQYAAYLISKVGYRKVMLWASILATLTTFAYALNLGIFVWLLARILWGFSFAALRLGSVGYAAGHRDQGLSLGLNKAIPEVGPLLALWLGPVLLTQAGFENTFLLFAVVTTTSIAVSLFLPEPEMQFQQVELKKLNKPDALDAWVFFSSFAVDGVLTVTIGLLFYNAFASPEKALALTAGYVAFRRLSTLVFTPVAGYLADKWGLQLLFSISLALLPVSFLAVAIGYVELGIVCAFFAYSVNSAFVPGIGLANVFVTEKLTKLASLSTSRDVGSATGTLFGAALLLYFSAEMLYTGLAALLVFGIILYYRFYPVNQHGISRNT